MCEIQQQIRVIEANIYDDMIEEVRHKKRMEFCRECLKISSDRLEWLKDELKGTREEAK